jgi:hypothetical protein
MVEKPFDRKIAALGIRKQRIYNFLDSDWNSVKLSAMVVFGQLSYTTHVETVLSAI